MLVVYFSRPGENLNVGVVAEGSTSKLARMIAERTGAAMVAIVPDRPYPTGYEDAKAVIQRELDTDARPSITLRLESSDAQADAAGEGAVDVESAIGTTDLIALGYPVWCGSLPMPVRTFLDAHDLRGKTILPFSTNEGSGLARTMDELRAILPDSTVREGLPVLGSTVQRDAPAARSAVDRWLAEQR